MLAQSHARKPAPALAARAFWLRSGLGVDAFGSALGDAVVGSIQQADSKHLTDAQIDKYLEGVSGSGNPQATDDGGYFPSRSVQTGQTYSDAYGPVNSFRPTADASGNAFGIYPSDDRGFFPPSAEPEPRTEPIPGTMGPRRDGPDAFSDGIAKSFADDVAARKAASGTSLWDKPVPGLSDLHGYVGQKIDDNFGNNWLGKGLNLVNDFAIPSTYGDLAMTGLGMVFPEGRAISGEMGVARTLRSSELGELLGRGGNKEVFAFGEDQAVGVLRAGKNPAMLTEELSLLKRLDNLGLPTVNARGPISVDVQPALLFDRFEQGSKDIVRLQDGRVRTVGTSDLLNERSISDLQSIRQTMVDKSVKVDDLQFLIGKNGRVVIADPLGVSVGQTPSKNNLKMIDLLIDSAKQNRR